jgi:hypothetical protein
MAVFPLTIRAEDDVWLEEYSQLLPLFGQSQFFILLANHFVSPRFVFVFQSWILCVLVTKLKDGFNDLSFNFNNKLSLGFQSNNPFEILRGIMKLNPKEGDIKGSKIVVQ